MNYGDLKTQFEGLLKRRDLTSTLRDGFITQGIARAQTALAAQGIPAMETSVDLTTSDTEVSIPNDLLRLKSITTSTSDHAWELRLTSLTKVLALSALDTDFPRYYTRRGSKWLLAPAPVANTPLRIDYYAELDALVNDTDTNWLTDLRPSAILYPALAAAALYYMDKRAPAWEAGFQQEIAEITAQSAADELLNAHVSPAFSWPEC